ncbi:shikimate kinase [Celeribacter arenosi]
MMGAGKSAIGKALALRLNVPFLDSDMEIEKAADRSIAEIFQRDGEAFFRAKESQVIERLLLNERCILSTGGGAFLTPENRRMIASNGIAVWLKADTAILWSRVKHKGTRPLLQTENPYQTLVDLAQAREPAYAEAGLIVEAEMDMSIDEMTSKVIRALRAHGGILEDDQ